MKGFSPPIDVLLEFCRQAPGLHVGDDAIVTESRVNPDEVLSQIEKQAVHTLFSKRRTVTVSELKSICHRIGLNQTTCDLYLVYSPFILKYGHNRYGLIGPGREILSGVA